MRRILVTGGSSYLGRHLVPIALQEAEVCYTYFQHDPLKLPHGKRVDMRDEKRLLALVEEFEPDVIIHLAGSNRGDDFELVIRQGAQSVTKAARRSAARLIHLSTDSLLDGKQAPYTEADPPSPITSYGRAKADAEQSVSRWENHVIIRTSLIYSLSIMDHSTRWISEDLRQAKPVTLFTNQIRNPVWTDTLCRACLELAGNKYYGIINIAGWQSMSRAEFGLKMLDWWGINERGTLRLGSADDTWPLDCRLDLSLATDVLATPLYGLDDVLAHH